MTFEEQVTAELKSMRDGNHAAAIISKHALVGWRVGMQKAFNRYGRISGVDIGAATESVVSSLLLSFIETEKLHGSRSIFPLVLSAIMSELESHNIDDYDVQDIRPEGGRA